MTQQVAAGPDRRRVGADGALEARLAELEAAGLRLEVELPDGSGVAVGPAPGRARVVLGAPAAVRALVRRDLLALAEAYLAGDVEVEGDFREVVRITDVMEPGPTRWGRLRAALRLALGSGRRLRRAAVAFHYDRPPELFLPWFERWRSYSHGLYVSPDERPEAAQARKLQRAIDALGLEPGMDVFDMGCGWGSFLEYAGMRGIRVHGITLSAEQHRFVSRLIRERRLPCTVALVDFQEFRPARRFHGAVFMGSLEHFDHPRAVAAFLERHLEPGARVWADFCTASGGRRVGPFLARHVFPGPAAYVDVPALQAALEGRGFALRELADDTSSYALSCRDWADALDREAKALAERFDEETVRVFRVFLRASQHFFETGRTRAMHLVAERGSGRPLDASAGPAIPRFRSREPASRV